jgi:hypothetical protein
MRAAPAGGRQVLPGVAAGQSVLASRLGCRDCNYPGQTTLLANEIFAEEIDDFIVDFIKKQTPVKSAWILRWLTNFGGNAVGEG